MKNLLKVVLNLLLKILSKKFQINIRISLIQLINFIDDRMPNAIYTNEKISESLQMHKLGHYDEAKSILEDAIKLDPRNPKIAPHLSRLYFLNSRLSNKAVQEETKEMLEMIKIMEMELKSNPIYVPGEFWRTIGNFHIEMLVMYGVENFKRTVSHHYQNWLMVVEHDEQFLKLLSLQSDNFSIQPWFNIIEVPDNVGISQTMDFSTPTYPLAIKDFREVYLLAVGMLWEYVKDQDITNIMEEISESEIGNPIRIWRKGKLISSDIAHSVRERNLLLKSSLKDGTEKLLVGELGAGHGRLAEIFGKTTNYRYYIFDISPTLYVSQYYIKKLFPNEKIFEFRHFDNYNEICNELETCRFAFFTSNQLELMPNDIFHIFVNLNSLAEMRLDQIKNFIDKINKSTSGTFFSRQQIKSINPIELQPLSKGDFAMPEMWRLILDAQDAIHPQYFNQIWQKRVIIPKN